MCVCVHACACACAWLSEIDLQCYSTFIVHYLITDLAGSGVSVALMGITYYANIHMLWYFIVVQIFGGVMQVSIQTRILHMVILIVNFHKYAVL